MTSMKRAELREPVHATLRRIGRRDAMVAAVAGAAVMVAIGAGGCTSTPTPTPTPSTSPTSTSAAVAAPLAVPGTLVYLSVKNGQPIVMTTVTDGVAHQSSFGTATATDEYVLVPSPDATKLAAIESPDPGQVAPGDLVVIATGGARHKIASNIRWGGGNVPVWTPDGQHLIADIGGRSSLIDITTGKATAAHPATGNENYLTWSDNGKWRAYGGGTDVVVTAADGGGEISKSVAALPECEETAGCPTSVQAVSDDGRYVAVGHMNSDPSHVTEAHIVLDMQTGKTVALPNGNVEKIFFRPDGSMVVRTATGNKWTFLLVRRDGTTIATIPDTNEQGTDGTHLVAYHP
jgi:hypothetical protein